MKIIINILFSFSLAFGFIATISAFPLKYNSIFNFGDSLSDTGNFLLSGALQFPVIGKLPYGVTFFQRPTGRCSDGRLVVDFLAEASRLGYLPPYLGLEKGGNFKQGVNFAVAGATALNSQFFYDGNIGQLLWTNHSLNVQLDWFKKLKPSLCKTEQECDDYFKRALFLVGEIGGNDYNFQFLARRSIQQVRASVPSVVEAISNAASVLIEEGAMQVLVPENLPIGCSAVYLTFFQSPNKTDYDENGCLKAYNSFSMYHNQQLLIAIENLRHKYPRTRIMYADYYGSAMQFFRTPKQYGFENGAIVACCGGGGPYNFNNSARCGHVGSTACANPSTYANWDGIHLTEAAYRVIANGLINGPFSNPPLKSVPL